MNGVKIVVLGRYPDIFGGFYESAERYEPNVPKIFIRDGDKISLPIGWITIDGPEKFSYSHNVNLGWEAAGSADVLLCGDDTRFTQPFISELQKVMYADPTIGICCPDLGGHSPFCCGLFRRSVLDIVGPMDEQFKFYAFDDNDWAHRMGLAGFRTQPVSGLGVIHSSGGTSFYRREHEDPSLSVQRSCDENKIRFEKKWSQPPVSGEDRWEKQ